MQAGDGPAQADVGARPHRGLGERLGDGAEPAARVEEGAAPAACAAGEPAHDVGRRRRADPPPGQLAGQIGGVGVPQLAGVRTVERVEHRRAEPGPDHLGERVGAGRRSGPVAASTAARAAKRRGVRRSRSPVRSGKASHRSSRRMRPWRGRVWRSAPSSSRSAPSTSGGVAGWRRWLPWSTRNPATSNDPAMPPTAVARSRTTTSWPASAARHAAASPAGPAPRTAITGRRAKGHPWRRNPSCAARAARRPGRESPTPGR